jgi:hypothetical protein
MRALWDQIGTVDQGTTGRLSGKVKGRRITAQERTDWRSGMQCYGLLHCVRA